MKKSVKIIDSVMGTGKTSWAIEEMCNNVDRNYIYITPYLDELKRIKEATKEHKRMYEPTYNSRGNKRDNFHKLLMDGKNVCSTHALFTKANDITRQAIQSNKYTLILDEVMNVVSELEDFTPNDLKILLNEDFAYVEDYYLVWNENKEDEQNRYVDIRNMCRNKNIIVIGDKLVYWSFPIDIFKYFDEVYILTYLFDGQLQKYYYDFHNVEYTKYQLRDYKLIPYDIELTKQRILDIAPLINIYEGKYNLVGEDKYSLSKTWFEKDIKDESILSGILQKNISNFFNNEHREYSNKERIWCTFKDSQSKLKGKGYTKRHVSMNMRATNDYRECSVAAYCCNRFMKPTMKIFFSKRDIVVDEELWAISELIQWVWRSRIRENKEIFLYLPSKRMRELLQLFLQNKLLN